MGFLFRFVSLYMESILSHGEGCGDSKEFAFCERFTLASPLSAYTHPNLVVFYLQNRLSPLLKRS
jgi:hypothetical protein